VASLLARLRCLAEWSPELGLPALDEAFLTGLLTELAPGCCSFADLARAPLAAALKARLDGRQLAALERDAPERIERMVSRIAAAVSDAAEAMRLTEEEAAAAAAAAASTPPGDAPVVAPSGTETN